MKPHHFLLVVPFIWQLGFAAWANGVQWRPFELPFQMVWQMAGVVISSAVIGLMFWLDHSRSDARDEADQ